MEQLCFAFSIDLLFGIFDREQKALDQARPLPKNHPLPVSLSSVFAPIQHLFDFPTNTPLKRIVEKELFSITKTQVEPFFFLLEASSSFFAALEELFFEERKEGRRSCLNYNRKAFFVTWFSINEIQFGISVFVPVVFQHIAINLASV